MRYRIFYSFRGYGSTFIEAESEEEAREKWDEGEYESNNEDTEDYNIDEIASQEAIDRQDRANGMIANERAGRDTEHYCACGNPVEEIGELCDQCWIEKEDLAVAAKK